MESTFLLDDYAATRPGEPYRLFPYGTIIKNGKKREITPDLARLFRLPHFKPPMKLGSHEDTTPAGGHILALEVRDDGLYAIPELTDKGAQAISAGDYRYHSPEVIWGGGGYEDPTTGDIIEGPLIVGDALLHTPHLGEATALYSVQTTEVQQMDEAKELGIFERFVAYLDARKPVETPEPEKAPEVDPEQFAAVQVERDNLKAEIDKIKAEREHAARVDEFAAKLKDTKVGDGAAMLASMTDQQATWVLEQFSALSAQVNESALTGELGSSGDGPDTNPVDALNAAIKSKMAEAKVDYAAAIKMVDPELVAKVYGK